MGLFYESERRVMTWKVWGTIYNTSDASNTNISQKVKFTSNQLIVAARTWVVVYNNPTFTSISLKIYSDRAGTPGKLLHTCDTARVKTDLVTLANALIEPYFEFNAPDGIPVKANDSYHFVLNMSGYTGDQTSHLAWKKDFPDPVYRDNLNYEFEDLLVAPHAITFISAEL